VRSLRHSLAPNGIQTITELVIHSRALLPFFIVSLFHNLVLLLFLSISRHSGFQGG
jgi:hypothetical protein